MEVLYMFHEIPTSIWPLVYVQTFLRYFYIIVGFNHTVRFIRLMELVGALQRFPVGQLYFVNISYIDILKLMTSELTYSVLKKFLIPAKFMTFIYLLCIL